MRPALATAWEYTETREDAEDIVQDAFVRTLRALHRYDQARPFGSWFFTIVRNTARNAAAARATRQARHAAQDPGATHGIARPPVGDVQGDGQRIGAIDDRLERAELRARLDRAIGALPRMQRACFRLCEAEGFSRAEVAAMLGVSEATVRVHLYRARKKLRLALEPVRDDIETG